MFDKEKVIRKEAKTFLLSTLTKFWHEKDLDIRQYLGRRLLFKELKEEINRFHTSESKVIFLDELKELTLKTFSHHKTLKTEDREVLRCFRNLGDEECESCDGYESIFLFLQEEIDSLPKIVQRNKYEKDNGKREKVFISYSHKDEVWLDMLKRHFKPFEGKIDFWEDSKINLGKKWKTEIEKAISECKVAILLISADFFNSEFIIKNELPPLLEAAEKKGALIISVILKPCLFDEYPEISQFQAINSPNFPIIQMEEWKRELTWVELVKQIKEIFE